MSMPKIPKADSYDNVFPYVNTLSQRFSTVIPYAVDANGEKIEDTPNAIRCLYAPNSMFSCMEFLKLISATVLTQSHLDILIWTRSGADIIPGGKVSEASIAGYTLLPQNSRQYTQDRSDWYHQVTLNIDGQPRVYNFSRDETIALTYSSHPLDPTVGVAPAMTVRKWASVDDMIADYERGFFGNGAVPSGMINIVANDAQDFMRNKNRLEDTFRGAGNNNGVVYNYVPIDPMTGNPTAISKISWVPFQQSNNSLDLATLDDVVNRRMANAMAVPDIVRGIDNGQTYANAEMAERSFIENTLKPLCMTVWDKFQFELDRITGGIGYGITFDLDLPAQTDVEKIQAETQQVKVNTLINLVNAGASIENAVKALGLPDEFNELTIQPVVAAKRETFARKSSLLKKCEKFYNGVADIAMRGRFDAQDDLEKLEATLKIDLYDELERTVCDYAKKNGLTLYEALVELSETDADIKRILDEADNVPNITAWSNLPETYRDAYMQRLDVVCKNAGDTAMKDIRRILELADSEEWTMNTLKNRLSDYCEGYRAKLLARNETVNAERLGNLYSALGMGDSLGVKIVKVWYTTAGDDACPLCRHLNGREEQVDTPFLRKGAVIDLDDYHFENTWMDRQTADAHPNCRCTQTYKITGVK